MQRALLISRISLATATIALALAASVQAAPFDAAPAPPLRPAGSALEALRAAAWTSTAPEASIVDAVGDGVTRDLRAGSVRQAGPDLIVAWRLDEALAQGAITAARPLCIRFGWGDAWRRQACIVHELSPTPARISSLMADGGRIDRAPAARTWRSADRRSVFLQLPVDALAAPLMRWQVSWSVRSSSGGSCTIDLGCVDVVPMPAERTTFRPRRWQRAGCTARAPWRQRLDASSRGPRRIALTFDDGPAGATGRILRTLKRLDAPATFFVLGIQVRAEPDLARRIVAQGHEIGSHSWEHDYLPDRADQRQTLNYINTVTGYRPCIWRPPYGAISREELADARALGTNTINWDVDPNDWRGGTSSSIAAHVLGYAHTGSIVLMHDGGGGGSRTAGAVESIVRGLRGRGYELVTVSELLGLQPRWKYAA